jgi:hypothetical protein
VPTIPRPQTDRFGSTKPKPSQKRPSNAHQLRNSGRRPGEHRVAVVMRRPSSAATCWNGQSCGAISADRTGALIGVQYRGGGRAYSREVELPQRCPGCDAAPGSTHEAGCEVERCSYCGAQRLGCEHEAEHDPELAYWTGYWPGDEACRTLGIDHKQLALLVTEWRAKQLSPR